MIVFLISCVDCLKSHKKWQKKILTVYKLIELIIIIYWRRKHNIEVKIEGICFCGSAGQRVSFMAPILVLFLMAKRFVSFIFSNSKYNTGNCKMYKILSIGGDYIVQVHLTHRVVSMGKLQSLF